MKGILGIKLGMTQVFTEAGALIPVTVVEVEPNTVLQVKTKETDGYDALQLGIEDVKESRATKPEIGHAKKAGTSPKKFVKEVVNDEGNYDPDTSLTYYVTSGLVAQNNNSEVREEVTAWYEAEKARISEKESYLDIDMDNLSTELESINTEIQSIQSLIDDAISSVFDWGSK